MKHLKIYEDLNIIPKVGDYVLMSTKSRNPKVIEFIENTMGRITDVFNGQSIGSTDIEVTYDNIPTFLIDSFSNKSRTFDKNQII